MKKRMVIITTAVILFTVLTIVLATMWCCKIRSEAEMAVDEYNVEAVHYNESIAPYNEAAEEVIKANEELSNVTNAAQDVINRGEEPYDPETLTLLKKAVSSAQEEKAFTPEVIFEAELLAITDEMKLSDLRGITEQANTEIEVIKAAVIPEIPKIPDYSDAIEAVKKAQKVYEDSIQSLKQVTAPSDEFVLERLQRVDTITMIDAVTEGHDPNGKLGKQGGYIGCIYFRDSQVDQAKLYVNGNPDDVIDVGTKGGGALEIFLNIEDAEARNTYLGGFDGTVLVSGSHYVVGTILIRTSDELSGAEQLELTDKITQALVAVD